ncbi:hypothetical protein LINPERPRIM_LOCUS33073 [Linum perenne]
MNLFTTFSPFFRPLNCGNPAIFGTLNDGGDDFATGGGHESPIRFGVPWCICTWLLPHNLRSKVTVVDVAVEADHFLIRGFLGDFDGFYVLIGDLFVGDETLSFVKGSQPRGGHKVPQGRLGEAPIGHAGVPPDVGAVQPEVVDFLME